MPTTAAKKMLLNNALNKFYDITGFKLKVAKQELPLQSNDCPDAFVRLHAPQIDRQFVVDVKQRLNPNTLGATIHQLEKYPGKGLLVADYINPHMAERLKEMNVPFMDEAGNVYLNEPPLFIYIKGNKQTRPFAKKPPTLAFQAGGLRILFLYLCRPELIDAPYRLTAHAAGVALGTVGWVVRDLKQMGLLMILGKKKRKLTDKEKIIRRWAEAYPEKLRPKIVIGRYKAKDDLWWQYTDLDPFTACWGGETAAAKLTQYLKPVIQTIYIAENPTKFIIQNRLTKAPNGNVEILQTFWKFQDNQLKRESCVPPLLIYADLLATADPRNMETARIIYDQYLTRLIRED